MDAPKSARTSVQNGPAKAWVKSRTRIPSSAAPNLLRHPEVVDLNLQLMIDPGAPNPVRPGGHTRFRRGGDHLTVYGVIDLVGAHPNLQGVGRFPALVGLLDGIAGGFRRYVFGLSIAVAMLDQPHAVLRDHEVEIILLWSFQVAAAKHQPVVVRVAARFH